MAVEDSVRMVLAAYEHDRITLDSAAQRLADLLEPSAGLAASGSMTSKAREALEAAHRVLARRAMDTALQDSAIATDPVLRILVEYDTKRITADSAAKALSDLMARTHRSVNMEMDSALREAWARLARASDTTRGGSRPSVRPN